MSLFRNNVLVIQNNPHTSLKNFIIINETLLLDHKLLLSFSDNLPKQHTVNSINCNVLWWKQKSQQQI